MTKQTKEYNLNLISSADAMIADIGLTERVEDKNLHISLSPKIYFDFAFKLWKRQIERDARSDKYKKMHSAYLRTPEWNNKRHLRMKHDKFICVDCGNNAQCVHHLHYRTWRHEIIETDLVSLCNDCHYSRHFGNIET